jgi:hypothetical protein
MQLRSGSAAKKLTRNALTSTFAVKSKRIPLNFSPENVSGASVF